MEEFFNQKEIGGDRYNVVALNGNDAWDGWTLILKTIAPVMGEVLDSRNTSEEAMMFEKANTWREVLTIVTRDLNTPEFKYLTSKMLQGTTKNGEPLNIEKDFTGKVHRMMELIMFALEVNFKGFFTESDMFQSLIGNLGTVMTGIVGE